VKIKRKTEAEKKAALLQRVTDVYSGAMDGVWRDDDFASAEILSRVIPVISSWAPSENQSVVRSPHCLHYFDRPEMVIDFLYRNGVRA